MGILWKSNNPVTVTYIRASERQKTFKTIQVTECLHGLMINAYIKISQCVIDVLCGKGA